MFLFILETKQPDKIFDKFSEGIFKSFNKDFL